MKPTELESTAPTRRLSGPDNRPPDLKDPTVVLSFLEADQVVAAKQRTHFGRRHLPLGARLILWGLRIYVLVMLVLVIVSAIRALRFAP
jgi:hypothetical protein